MGDADAPAPRDTATFEVRDALARPGCPVCGLALRAVGRFIESVSYEQVNDPGLRAELRTAHGFCNTHAFRWLREARSVLGTAIIYRDVLRTALRGLGPQRPSGRRRRGVFQALLGSSDEAAAAGGCPACRVQREAEARYLGALLEALADPSVSESFRRSAGLCLVHTLGAARLGGAGAERAADHARRATQRLIEQLNEVIRKEDYRFRREPRPEGERSAPRRAVEWAAGVEGLVRK